ncbi:uncharacterized protein LOC122084707 isoform X2 [Macadamia integrifolia]|uniref:uncharacterized protein LOC122084707 isoform X2 n=1 Tax=Macadamia integrifolia TaxID=60698 RepID=UPI001C4F138F|nr:uncharacterized protein LOC122084707 isoform X2 [Macadamia integrifolia]
MLVIGMPVSAMAPSPLTVPPSNNPPSSSSMRSPSSSLQSQQLSLGLLSLPPSTSGVAAPPDHHVMGPEPIAIAQPLQEPTVAIAPVARIRLSDIIPYDGAPVGTYSRSVEALSGSITRHNAAVIELGSEESALMRCALESARLYFRMGAQSRSSGGSWGKASRGVYIYRGGRAFEDGDSSPPCMADVFRCMGKAARAALCAIARHLRLRSDVFNHLLDDTPLPANEASSSLLVAAYSHPSLQNCKGAIVGGKPAINSEVEKGLLTLITSDSPGIQVCDPNSRWYLADGGSGPGDLLLLTGKALSHATAGLRPAASYRAAPDYSSATTGRTSLAFRLMPQGNAILDCSPIAAVGHVIPQSYVPISVSQFMDDLSTEEDVVCNRSDNAYETRNNLNRELSLSLRSVLSDPMSGAFLEDAVVVSCGHSFGGLMLRKVLQTTRCTLCGVEIEGSSLIPNHALRAAAAAVKHEDDRRLFHNSVLRKRRREVGEQMDAMKRINRVYFKERPEKVNNYDIHERVNIIIL